MPIRFRCPCGRIVQTPLGSAGRKARCFQCGRLLRVPEMADEDLLDLEDDEETKSEVPAKARVLLAESDYEQRIALRDVLEAHGYLVIEAADGEMAVQAAREKRPELMVVDVQLSKLGGFQVVQALKDPLNPRNNDCWQTPIIMTAGTAKARDRQYAISVGVAGYLEKPVAGADLCSRIDRLLSSRRLD